MAYVSGKPIMSDKEYDELKMKLKVCYFQFINEKSFCSGCSAFMNWFELIVSLIIEGKKIKYRVSWRPDEMFRTLVRYSVL